jgi:integrating conjugative element protein (TIGR03755 family)
MKAKHFRLIGVVVLMSLVTDALAQENRSPRLRNALEYQLGGGLISAPPTPVTTVPVLDFGAGWDAGMECGKFDPKMTVANQLNGLTDGFRSMMDNIISSATSAVASLPALAIQRADPGLYDLLQQGILQGKMDFEFAQTSCDDMAAVMMGDQGFPWEKYKVNAKVGEWSYQIGQTGGDAKKAKDAVDSANTSDDGAEWVCGALKGGAGQAPIRALRDIIIVGYNVLFDRTNSCDTASVPAVGGQGTPLWEYWNGPVAAANWATAVIGDTELRTCNGCTKLKATPGKGLTYQHRDMTETLFDDIDDLVKNITPLTWQNLNRVSAPPGVLIDDVIIAAIRKRPANAQQEMISKLSSEIAYTRLVEQGRLVTQMLRSGIKEPNAANMEQAKQVVNEAIDHLQVELGQLDAEIEARQAVAKLTIQRILGNEEREVQNVRAPNRSQGSGVNSLGNP